MARSQPYKVLKQKLAIEGTVAWDFCSSWPVRRRCNCFCNFVLGPRTRPLTPGGWSTPVYHISRATWPTAVTCNLRTCSWRLAVGGWRLAGWRLMVGGWWLGCPSIHTRPLFSLASGAFECHEKVCGCIRNLKPKMPSDASTRLLMTFKCTRR